MRSSRRASRCEQERRREDWGRLEGEVVRKKQRVSGQVDQRRWEKERRKKTNRSNLLQQRLDFLLFPWGHSQWYAVRTGRKGSEDV